jgi:hypothetical protein
VKYRTFVLIRNTVAGVLIVGAGFGVIKGCSSATRTSVNTSAPVTSPRRPQQATTAPTALPAKVAENANPNAGASPAVEEPLSSLHKDVLELAKQPLTNGASDGKSRKWRVKRAKIIIELRSDTDKGATTWNRLKIDLDGDKKWDESWDLVTGKPVKRRTSPADDGELVHTYDLKGERWVPRKPK